LQDSGAAYVYRHDGAEWIYLRRLAATFLEQGDWAGNAVAACGDMAVVGVMWDDNVCPEDPACDSGSACVFSAAELNLLASANEAMAGDTLEFETCYCETGDPVVFAVTKIDTSFVFYPIVNWIFDADCRLTFDVTIPPGFAGYKMSMQSFALSVTGYPTESNRVTILFR
jgi:hypothetical protein